MYNTGDMFIQECRMYIVIRDRRDEGSTTYYVAKVYDDLDADYFYEDTIQGMTKINIDNIIPSILRCVAMYGSSFLYNLRSAEQRWFPTGFPLGNG